MELRYLFTFTFGYGCLLYVITQYGEMEGGKSKTWCIVDAIVVSVFIKNALASYLFFDSIPVQGLVAFVNTSTVLWFLLPQTGLGKRFTVHFAFVNLTLAPLIFVFLYGDKGGDCGTHVLGFVLATALPAWFVTTTANAEVKENAHVSARACAWAALLAQNLSTWPALAMCFKGDFLVNSSLWLALLRFGVCAILAFSVTAERMNMQST